MLHNLDLVLIIFSIFFQQARSRDLPSYNSPSVQQILDPAGTNFGAGSSTMKEKCCQNVT